MHVLIVGGSGFVGSALASDLADSGRDVAVLSRTPDDADLPAAVETVAGDVTEYESIEHAFEGIDVVVNLVALSPLFEPTGGNDRHFAVHRDGTEHVVRAAEAHGVRRVVQMSALGADPAAPTAFLRSKGEAEAVVRAADLESVIVRPSVIFGEGGEFVAFTRTLTTPYVTGLPGGGKTRFQPIWIGDLVPMLADCVTDEEGVHAGATYELGGPEILSLADVARLAHRANGRSLRVLPVPMPVARLGMTVAGWIPPIPFGPDQYRSLRLDNVTGPDPADGNDVTAFGRDVVDLRSLGAYLGLDSPSDASVGTAGDSGRPARTGVLASVPVLAVFAFLVASWSLQYVTSIYAHPVIRWLFVPSYLVTMVTYDGGLGLEAIVNPVASVLPVGGVLLWELGNLLTYYLVALAIGGPAWLLARRWGVERTDRGSAGS